VPEYAETFAALPAFRNVLFQQPEHVLIPSAFSDGEDPSMSALLSRIHATGIGLRRRKNDRYVVGSTVLKVFTHERADLNLLQAVMLNEWEGIPIDVDYLPVVQVHAEDDPACASAGSVGTSGSNPSPPNRHQHRPIIGGLSISPLGTNYVGTLGCFLNRQGPDGSEILALSNNHVLADTDRLSYGTLITQPGPEVYHTPTINDAFASLSYRIPLQFPTTGNTPVSNEFDAAVATVTDLSAIQTGKILGIHLYNPSPVKVPQPGMEVIKSGRTTGVTRGLITATNISGVNVNYGTLQAPWITVFDDVLRVQSHDQNPFASPGDSGSVILEEATGNPVALIFAGRGRIATACDLGALCQHLGAWPV